MQSISRRFLASRVDVSVGLGAVDEEKNYRNARHARFKTGVVLQYKKREKSASRMEMKQVFGLQRVEETNLDKHLPMHSVSMYG